MTTWCQMAKWILLIGLALLVGGCGSGGEDKPGPMDFTRETMGYYCGMALVEHEGPKGQIYAAGERGPLWFSSVRDALSFLQLEGATRRIRGFYVNDMSEAPWSQPGPWIDGEKAYYVLGSNLNNTMGTSEIIPFATTSAAKKFSESFGGQVKGFGEIAYEEVVIKPAS